MERNHTRLRVTALSAEIPTAPKKNAKAPSLIPIPDIERGTKDIRTMAGIKIIKTEKVILIESPRARINTAKKLIN